MGKGIEQADNSAKEPRYPNPPITEAVIEIRLEGEVPEAERRKVSAKLGEFYPNETVHENQHIHVDVDHGTVERRVQGSVLRRSSSDESEILLLQPGIVTVSQLAVYPGWEYFISRFRRDWGAWRKTVGYRKVERVGVRFINRIDVPREGTTARHEDYLKLFIQVPASIPTIGDYSLQFTVPLPDIKCGALINSASIPSPLANFASFLIDIDVGRLIDVPQKDDDILNMLEEMRRAKNALFEAFITDAARERFFDDHQLR